MSIIPSIFGGRRSSVFDPFSLDVWDPFKDMSASFPEISKEATAIVNARVDWKETPEAHVFKADLPGLKKEEVKVEVEDGRVLQISGERSKESEEKNDKWHRIERSSGKFVRRFQLPENAKMEEVKASIENGVLTVTVPKEQVKKPEVKAIEISAVAVVVDLIQSVNGQVVPFDQSSDNDARSRATPDNIQSITTQLLLPTGEMNWRLSRCVMASRVYRSEIGIGVSLIRVCGIPVFDIAKCQSLLENENVEFWQLNVTTQFRKRMVSSPEKLASANVGKRVPKSIRKNMFLI